MDEHQVQERMNKRMDQMDLEDGISSTFRETVLVALAKIESLIANQTQNYEAWIEESRKDRERIHECIDKIPAIEIGLNNHLHTHDTVKKYVMYPVAVAIMVALLGVFAKVVLHVF